MTHDEIHHRIVTLAEEMMEHYHAICTDLPQDAYGFPMPENPDLAKALKTILYVDGVLSRLAFKMERERDQ